MTPSHPLAGSPPGFHPSAGCTAVFYLNEGGVHDTRPQKFRKKRCSRGMQKKSVSVKLVFFNLSRSHSLDLRNITRSPLCMKTGSKTQLTCRVGRGGEEREFPSRRGDSQCLRTSTRPMEPASARTSASLHCLYCLKSLGPKNRAETVRGALLLRSSGSEVFLRAG